MSPLIIYDPLAPTDYTRSLPVNGCGSHYTPQPSTAADSTNLSNAPIEPDANTVYVRIRRPDDVHYLTSPDTTAPLGAFALDDAMESLAHDITESQTASKIFELRNLVQERSQDPTFDQWRKHQYDNRTGSRAFWQDPEYENWEEVTYELLKGEADFYNAGRGRNGLKIAVIKDDDTLAQLEKAGCREMRFSYFEKNSKTSSIQKRTDECSCS